MLVCERPAALHLATVLVDIGVVDILQLLLACSQRMPLRRQIRWIGGMLAVALTRVL